jgi:hypothetical protein
LITEEELQRFYKTRVSVIDCKPEVVGDTKLAPKDAEEKEGEETEEENSAQSQN